MDNPFVRTPIDTTDFRNALSDIKSDIETAQELIARSERTRNVEDEMRMALHLSGLEIKMTNFAKTMREKFA